MVDKVIEFIIPKVLAKLAEIGNIMINESNDDIGIKILKEWSKTSNYINRIKHEGTRNIIQAFIDEDYFATTGILLERDNSLYQSNIYRTLEDLVRSGFIYWEKLTVLKDPIITNQLMKTKIFYSPAMSKEEIIQKGKEKLLPFYKVLDIRTPTHQLECNKCHIKLKNPSTTSSGDPCQKCGGTFETIYKRR